MASHPWRLMEKIDWTVLAVDLAEELSAFPFVGDITSLSSQEKWQHLSKMLKKNIHVDICQARTYCGCKYYDYYV